MHMLYTTSGFTGAARAYVARGPKRIVLIDCDELAHPMVKHDIAVRLNMRYEVKRIDEGNFRLETPWQVAIQVERARTVHAHG